MSRNYYSSGIPQTFGNNPIDWSMQIEEQNRRDALKAASNALRDQQEYSRAVFEAPKKKFSREAQTQTAQRINTLTIELRELNRERNALYTRLYDLPQAQNQDDYNYYVSLTEEIIDIDNAINEIRADLGELRLRGGNPKRKSMKKKTRKHRKTAKR